MHQITGITLHYTEFARHVLRVTLLPCSVGDIVQGEQILAIDPLRATIGAVRIVVRNLPVVCRPV